MHLERIELTNFRQYPKLDVNFHGNLIAVLGRNGCGKSNFIGAIQFVLTGEQPGATKADLTTWGEKEGSVRLYFTAGPKGDRFCLTRKTNGDATLKIGDETIKQARKVEAALLERAGIDVELLRQVVFINQTKIMDIISADPKVRETTIQRISGIAVASKIYEWLRGEIAAYDKPQGFDEAIARLRGQLADQENIAKVCSNVLDRYDTALKTLPSKESLEAEVDKCAGAQAAVKAFVNAIEQLCSTQMDHEKALERLAGIGAVPEDEEASIRNQIANLTAEADGIRLDLDKKKEAVRFLSRMKELSDAAGRARLALAAAKARSEDVARKYCGSLEEAKASVDKLTSEQVSAESELRSLRNLVKDASSDGTCPVCGAPASQEDISKHLSEKMASAEKRAHDAIENAKLARMAYDKRHAEESEASRDVDRRKSEYDFAFSALKNAHDKNVEGCKIDLDTFEVSYFGQKPNEVQSIQEEITKLGDRIAEINYDVGNARRKMSEIDAKRSQTKDARDSVAKLAAQIEVLMNNKRDCEEKLASLGIDPESVGSGEGDACSNALKKARENLDAYNGILQDMAAEKGKLDAAKKTIESTKKFIDDLVEKKSIEEAVQAKVDMLKRVRDWFHYKVGPRIVSQCVMRDLTEDVNRYLDQFNAPFVVSADEEGCGFRCRFIDGRTMPDPYPEAYMLSGGQKVALAFAFHLAIYMRFGGQLGFLSLDEPTAYLDDANIEHMGELLEKVGVVARNKGLQILMATHEKAIMPFLDSKIDLGALKGE